MHGGLPDSRSNADARPLQAFLLGTLDLDAVIALQRRLVYEVASGGTPAVILCDHPPAISIGREGSRSHIRPSPEVLAARRWPVKWVSRGGGCLLHLPGQVACYPILPLQELGTTPGRYIDSLNRIAADTIRELGAAGEPLAGEAGVRVAERRIAHVGVCVRDWVSSFGITVNVNPDLDPFREVRCDGDTVPMTSLQRESLARVRVTGVRQSLLDGVARRFGFTRVSVFHNHPTFLPKPTRHAFAPRSR